MEAHIIFELYTSKLRTALKANIEFEPPFRVKNWPDSGMGVVDC